MVFGYDEGIDQIIFDRDDEEFGLKKSFSKGFDNSGCDQCNNEKFSFMRFISPKKSYQTVCNYFHYTGKYRGAPHSICSFRYKTPNVISIFFHSG